MLFNEAKSFWQTASSAFSQALENLDAEIRAEEPSMSREEVLNQLEADLKAYKKLLEDAQMQHLELSRQSRILVAEKEAEIKILRSQLDPSMVESILADGSSLQIDKVVAEKKILEDNLRELEEKFRESLAEKVSTV